MIIAAHQPNFIPWIGYFFKLLKSDYFVLLDDVPFSRGSYTNRAKIKTPQGEQWLTLPVKKSGRLNQLISKAELDEGRDWRRKALGIIQGCYWEAPFFKAYLPQFGEILEGGTGSLAQINAEIIAWMAGILEISTPMVKSSELTGVDGHSTERLVSICKALGADEYLSGFGGQKYQDAEVFHKEGIRLSITDFQHPQYTQLWGEFRTGLSTIDLIFNCGPTSARILRGNDGR
jgi:hypothetical protein